MSAIWWVERITFFLRIGKHSRSEIEDPRAPLKCDELKSAHLCEPIKRQEVRRQTPYNGEFLKK